MFAGTVTPDVGCYAYARSFNPTTRALGALLAALEGTEAGYATASGLSAIAAVVLNLCDTGDAIVSASTIYGGTFALFHDFLPRKCGITTVFVDAADTAAAAAVLASRENLAGKVYELAGDSAFTLAEYAAEIAKQSGKPVVYKDLPEADYKAALKSVGLPEAFAGLLAESSAQSAKESLYETGKQLSGLIGRPTTPLSQSIAAALAS